MELMLSMQLRDTDKQIADMIMSELRDYMNNILLACRDNIENLVIKAIGARLEDSPELDALLNGDLGKQLGLVSPGAVIAEIILTVQNNMKFTLDRVQVVGNTIASGGYKIEIIQSDFQDILGIPDTSYVTKNGVNIPWLNWLLFAGDNAIIYGYRIMLDSNSSESRTGAIMVRSDNGSWGIPSQYAGTVNDNFITRALSGIEEDIGDIIMSEMQRRT